MFDEEDEQQHDILGISESRYNSKSSQLIVDVAPGFLKLIFIL